MDNPYGAFAQVYDSMQYDVDYESWIKWIDQVIKEQNPKARTLLELACGTGTIALGLAERGYRTEGLDISEEMLSIAQQKAFDLKRKTVFYCQDMIHFSTHKSYDVIVCMCDGVNYITDENDLETFFQSVSKHLNPNGLFIIEMSSAYKLQSVIGNNTFAETFEDSAYIWENQFCEESQMLEFWLTLFMKKDMQYSREEEYHQQRAYALEEVQEKLCGYFNIIKAVDGQTFEVIKKDSERIAIVSVKKD